MTSSDTSVVTIEVSGEFILSTYMRENPFGIRGPTGKSYSTPSEGSDPLTGED